MTETHVLVDAPNGPVATVIVNRPQAMNALDDRTLRELIDVFWVVARAPEVRCVVLTGAGEKAFAAGADIKAMAGMGPAEARAFAQLGARLAEAIQTLPVPVIAAVNGFALGAGCELALDCDFIFAARTAKLGMPEVNLGVIPGFGGTQRLARRVGLARASELVFTGAILSADEAHRIGLVNRVVEPEALLTESRAVAQVIAGKAPLAIADAKRALRLGIGMSLPDGCELERLLFAGLFSTADQKEGMAAFIEKRPPKFGSR